MKKFVLALLLLFPGIAFAIGNEPVTPLPAVQPNASSYGVTRTFLQQEDAARYARTTGTSFVYAGGIHAVSATMTSAAFATEAFTTLGNRVTGNGSGGVAAIDYNVVGCDASDTAWVIISAQTANNVGQFVRYSTTNYFVDCTTTPNAPELPADAAWLMKVTIAGSALTGIEDARVPASYAQRGVYDPTDALYGAVVGGNATTNATAFQRVAESLAFHSGGTLWCPPGTFTVDRPLWFAASNIVIEGHCTISAASTFTANNSTNRGVLTLGQLTPGVTQVPISNVVIRNITLDGGTYGTPLYISNCTGCLVTHITAQNSDVGVIRGYLNPSLTVEYSRVINGNGVFGDGIYCGGCFEFRANNNLVNNYTRIGIVSEAEGATKTTTFWAVGNTISHAHDATGSENNAGIWSENTFATHIINNTIFDQWNTPSDIFGSRCIQLNDMQGGGLQTFNVYGNILSGCLQGIGVQPNATAQVSISQTQIRKGTVTNILWGILISSGGNISVDGLQLGDNTWAGGGGILVNVQSAEDIRNLTIRNVTSGETTTPTYSGGGGDIVIYAVASTGILQELTISDVQQARLIMFLSVPIVHITNSTLTASGAQYLLHASQYGSISNSTITQAAAGAVIFRALSTATTLLNNVVCHACTPTLSSGTVGAPHIWRMTHNTWDTGSRITVNGELLTDIRDSTFLDYPSDGFGAITGNSSSGYSWTLRVRNSDFSNAAGSIAIVMTADPATSVVDDGNTWNGAGLSLLFGGLSANLVGIGVISGSGVPEGIVTAKVGTLYRRVNGGAGTTLCVKESGTGNTGWVCK